MASREWNILWSPISTSISPEIIRYLKEDEGIAYRGLFLIDKQGIVRHQLINDLPLGRSVEEALRMVDALIFHENHGEVCPANWKSGAKGMIPTAEGLVRYFTPK